MRLLRLLLLRHRALWATALACTLLVRALVPSGWMPDVSHGTLTLKLCSGMTVAMPAGHGMPHGQHDGSGHKPELPCAFAGLGAGFLGAAPPALLVAAIAFALLLAALARPVPLPAPPSRLRPPLRAPPLLA